MSELTNCSDPHRQATFTVGNRVRRVVWGVVYSLFFRILPRPCHRLRATILRAFGANVASGAHVYSRCRIWAPWNLVVEREAGIADDVTLYSMATITIGERAVVSQGSHLCAGTHDYEDPSFKLYALPITIGAHAWICADSFIGPGVTIGEGAVIGARSVVTKDMPAWTVCAGTPCRPIKPRVLRQSE